MALVIEQCQVVPSPSNISELTLPLTYFDLVWLNFHRIRRILFYKFSVMKPNFVQTIIPSLKHSLSLALQHYMILAGNVVCPLISDSYPELRYVTGDSVSVTFFESDMNFDFLIGNHLRKAKDFYHLVPKLEECTNTPGVQLAPLLAIQVTLFPNHGISIGFTNHHVVGDGASIVGFIRAWALLNKFDVDESNLGDNNNNFCPCYDRSIIKDPYGQTMSQWDIMKNDKVEMCDIFSIPSQDKVRGTFIIKRDDIIKLKSLILSRRPGLTHVTSFTVTCAYVWTCLIKSETATTKDQEIDENVTEFFLFAADCRARLNPPLPSNYFGNCIVGYIASTRHVDLVGNEGFINGAQIIGEVIRKKRNDDEWILNGDWEKEVGAIDMNRTLSVAGSPKHDFYAVDFSWGRTEKIEYVSIDSDNGIAMSLNKSRNSDEDLEIGLCLPENRMNAFVAIFNEGLSIL